MYQNRTSLRTQAPCKFCGSLQGVESATHAVQQVLKDKSTEVIQLIDAENVFNRNTAWENL